MKVGLISLGCFKNQVDAEKILALLIRAGFSFCKNPVLCDVVIINTCSFIKDAKQESINNILKICELKKSSNIKKIVITGCLAQRYKKQIAKSIPEVDVVIGIGSNNEIAEIIKDSLKTDKLVESFSSIGNSFMEGARKRICLTPYDYVKIADGCNNCCAYCVIPQIKGIYKSRAEEAILKEVNWLATSGVIEINLIAQDTTNYGVDIYNKPSLHRLIEKISKISGIEWIRVLYCYPEHITDELLDVMANNKKVLKYLDVPLQHINEELLHNMKRISSRESINKLISKIRKKINGIILRTTFIVGLPGETEQQFEELCEFIKLIKFERMGSFAYSQEEGTEAAKMSNQVDEQLKLIRVQSLIDIQSSVIDNFSEALIGKTFDVLAENETSDGKYTGRTYMDAPEVDGKVYFEGNSVKIGDIVKVKIEDYSGYELFGKLI